MFCDTLYEDGDLYRFLYDIECHYKISIVRLCVGGTPLTLSYKERFIYNSRVANCSKILKSKPFTAWLKEHYSPDECEIVLGIDWTEAHRCYSITRNYLPYNVVFPLCEAPYLSKDEMFSLLKTTTGIEPPRLYKMGFSHNNCGGRCFKAGIGHYKLLLKKMPNRYQEVENAEQIMIAMIGKNVSILKRNGKPYTLRQLRLDQEANGIDQCQIDFTEDEIGGCGCFATLEED